MNHNAVDLDIAKTCVSFFTVWGRITKVIKKKLKRTELLSFFANYPDMGGNTQCLSQSTHL